MRPASLLSEGLRGYTAALLMVGLVMGSAWALREVLSHHAADLLFFIPILLAAGFGGLGPSLFAAGLGALAHGILASGSVFPRHDHLPADTVLVLALLGVALVAGRLAARLRGQAAATVMQAERDHALASFARLLIEAADERELGQAICREVSRLFGARVVVVGPSEPLPRLIASHPMLESLEAGVLDVARSTMAHQAPAGRGTASCPGSAWTFYPLVTSRGTVGALGGARKDGLAPVGTERAFLLDAILDLAALAIERHRLAGEAAEVERLRDQDRLRGALLSSVSHDLRTPLTSILAAASQLRCEGGANPSTLAMLEVEARRLDRYVANLLDMVRLEAGALRLRLEPVDLTDVMAGVLRDLGRSSAASGLRVEVPVDLPLVRLDPQLFHHCLLNLVDNALRHGGGHGVVIRGELSAAGVSLSVLDDGPGLPPGQESRIFDTFVRLRGSDRDGGTGLGLAIVKGFAEAMGLSVEAANRSDRPGAVFVLRIPSALVVRGMEVQAG